MKKFNLLALGKLVAAFLLSVLATNLVLADEVSVRFTFWDSPSEPVQLALREEASSARCLFFGEN